MATPPKRWTDAEREQILDMVRAGRSYRDISDETGAGIATISRWAAAAGIESPGAEQVAEAVQARKVAWAQRRAQLVDDVGDAAAKFVQRALDESDAIQGQKWMTAFAIAVDKAQLLSGGVTSRHEQLDAQRRRTRVEEIADELAQRRAVKDGTTGG